VERSIRHDEAGGGGERLDGGLAEQPEATEALGQLADLGCGCGELAVVGVAGDRGRDDVVEASGTGCADVRE
jgi:hypothetical protein